MSKPREPWWGYAKNVIRAYPEYKQELRRLRTAKVTPKYNANGGDSGIGKPTEETALRELPPKEMARLEAVERALQKTKQLRDGTLRVRLIELIYFRRSHTLTGAAEKCHVSHRTAVGWHGDFIRAVASELHLS